MHLLEQSAAGIAAVIQSGEPLLERARLKSVLAGKLGSGQVAAVEKLDELSALRGGVIRASRALLIHPQSLSPSTHLREDVLGLPLTIKFQSQGRAYLGRQGRVRYAVATGGGASWELGSRHHRSPACPNRRRADAEGFVDRRPFRRGSEKEEKWGAKP